GASFGYRVGDTVTLIGETQAAFPLSGAGALTDSMEILGGVRYQVDPKLTVDLGFGGGILSGAGTPDVRVLAGLTYSPAHLRPQLSCRKEGQYGPERLRSDGVDSDGDGLDDVCDACPAVAGKRADGCSDKDGDGLLDENDECPLEP